MKVRSRGNKRASLSSYSLHRGEGCRNASVTDAKDIQSQAPFAPVITSGEWSEPNEADSLAALSPHKSHHHRPRQAEKGCCQNRASRMNGRKPHCHVDLSSSRPTAKGVYPPAQYPVPERESSMETLDKRNPSAETSRRDVSPDVASRQTVTKEKKSFHIQIHIPCREANLVFMTYMREMEQRERNRKSRPVAAQCKKEIRRHEKQTLTLAGNSKEQEQMNNETHAHQTKIF